MPERMHKIERVDAALGGEEVDRPPFSIWYHFGDQHLDGKAHAETEYNFYRHYDLDFLKVMNDYEYPRPDGLYDVEKPEDWHRLVTVNPWEYAGYREQLVAMRELSKKLAGEAYFIDTIFSPWTVARNIAYKVIHRHMKENSEELLHGLDVITTNLERYVSALIEVGCSGIFLSIAGATRNYMTFSEYEKFGKPFDIRILRAAEDARFNVLHVHGSKIYFKEVSDYPVQAISWADRDGTNPSLSKARRVSNKCFMGGIDHEAFKETYLKDVEEQIKDAVKQVNRVGLIIAPGCSVKPNSYVGQIMNVRETLRRLVGRC